MRQEEIRAQHHVDMQTRQPEVAEQHLGVLNFFIPDLHLCQRHHPGARPAPTDAGDRPGGPHVRRGERNADPARRAQRQHRARRAAVEQHPDPPAIHSSVADQKRPPRTDRPQLDRPDTLTVCPVRQWDVTTMLGDDEAHLAVAEVVLHVGQMQDGAAEQPGGTGLKVIAADQKLGVVEGNVQKPEDAHRSDVRGDAAVESIELQPPSRGVIGQSVLRARLWCQHAPEGAGIDDEAGFAPIDLGRHHRPEIPESDRDRRQPFDPTTACCRRPHAQRRERQSERPSPVPHAPRPSASVCTRLTLRAAYPKPPTTCNRSAADRIRSVRAPRRTPRAALPD